MPSAPYDTVITVVNTVNTRLNGNVNTLTAIGGQILENTNAFSQQLVNTGWQKLQEFLVSHGDVRLRVPNFVLFNVPPVSSLDTAIQVTLSWGGYFDGATLLPGFALPQNLIRPLALAERATPPPPISPTNPSPAFIDMDLSSIMRIPSIPKQNWNLIAVWNNDQISMPGAVVVTDIRIDYAAYLPDFLDTGTTTSAGQYTRWFSQQIPILRAAESLASYVCAEVERARGNADAVIQYTQDAENAAMTGIIGRAA